ncbi:MAG: DUF1080 domain-containing protein, partial [Planctomycetota bacterium]
ALGDLELAKRNDRRRRRALLAWVFFMVSTGFGCESCGGQTPMRTTGDSHRRPWITLFDGTSLEGWDVLPADSAADWTVHDGAIVGHGSADRLSYLVWRDANLADFALELRYRLSGEGNTGIEIRAQPDTTGKRPLVGYHADLGHVGIGAHILGAWDLHFANRTEHACPRGTRLSIKPDGTAISTDLNRPFLVSALRRHGWNRVRIIAEGTRFRFFINDQLAAELVDAARQDRLKRGAIGLQIHDQGTRVEFAEIRIQRL